MTQEQQKINPRKFAQWILLVSITMAFAALTSVYIVSRGDGTWTSFELPVQFKYSLFIAIASSITMQWAYWAAKRDELTQVKIGIVITTLLGLAFCYSQYEGWLDLVSRGIFMVKPKDLGESFVYVITGVHVAHVLGGILYLLIVLARTFLFKVHKTNLLHISMCKTYWHFVGVLWVYLYLFLLLNR